MKILELVEKLLEVAITEGDKEVEIVETYTGEVRTVEAIAVHEDSVELKTLSYGAKKTIDALAENNISLTALMSYLDEIANFMS